MSSFFVATSKYFWTWYLERKRSKLVCLKIVAKNPICNYQGMLTTISQCNFLLEFPEMLTELSSLKSNHSELKVAELSSLLLNFLSLCITSELSPYTIRSTLQQGAFVNAMLYFQNHKIRHCTMDLFVITSKTYPEHNRAQIIKCA